MRRTRYLYLSLALACVASGPIRAGDDPPKVDQDEKSKRSVEERYQALLKEYQEAQTTFQQNIAKAKTDAERQKAFESYPRPERYFDKFLQLAEENPKSKVAFDALMWIVSNGRGSRDKASSKAFEILCRDHIDNERLGLVAQSLMYSMNPESERFLRAVLEKSPHRDVKGIACLTLAQFLAGQSKLVARMNETKDPNQVRMYKIYLGGEYAERLTAKGSKKLSKEAESFFERASKDYADVKTFRGTVGQVAERELFELKNLSIGKPAPEIVGEDIDGKPLKLSDFKGKVVVLDFFGDW